MKPGSWPRRLRTAGLAILAMAALTCAFFYAASERIVRRTFPAPTHQLIVPTDAASIAEGARLARIRGCNEGCHGKQGITGRVLWEEPWIGRMVAPNLTEVVRRYSNAELERAIRHGVRRDGRGLFEMPSDMFAHLDDHDLGAIIAFLRSEPRSDGPLASTSFGLLWRWELIAGDPVAAAITAGIDQDIPHPARENHRDALANGRYLAMSTCTECHAQDLTGEPGYSPALAIVAAYSPKDFTRLMRTGTALGGREVGEPMLTITRKRTPHFTDAELDDLYRFLRGLSHTD
jgi:mono/diheme cytochrome c family protein